jgi:hypothetical protein
MEYMALAMNSRQPLFKRHTLRSLLEQDKNTIALTLGEQTLNDQAWAVYRVRRLKLGKNQYWRSLAVESVGNRVECEQTIHAMNGQGTSTTIHARHVLESCWDGDLPWREHFLVAAPHLVAAKERPSFAQKWFQSHQLKLNVKR